MTFLFQSYSSWEVFMDVKRTTRYCKHALPLNSSSMCGPQSRILVNVQFSAWRQSLDTTPIKMAVEEVMNRTKEF